jgi:uncharacterized membrane-anchored protein
MSTRMKAILGAAGLVLILAAANFAVWQHEGTLARGQVMYLRLAPVDPRSIMQGDYMALRFELDTKLGANAPRHGQAVVRLDARGVAEFVRVHQGEALAANERLLEFRGRGRRSRIVTDAYFFEEGQGGRYATARFGELRVRPDGVALLVALSDESLARLGESRYSR